MKWRLLFLAGLFWACDDYNDCGVSQHGEELYIEFDFLDDNHTRDIIFNEMIVKFKGEPAITYQTEVAGTTFAFPLDLTANSTRFTFTTDTTDYELEFQYATEAILENPDCNPIVRIKNLSYDEVITNFDSVAIKVLELSPLISPHVEVYF